MESPEYYEYTRLRDVFMRDERAVAAMIDTLHAQRTLLHSVVATDDTFAAVGKLDGTLSSLKALRQHLQAEVNTFTILVGEAVTA